MYLVEAEGFHGWLWSWICKRRKIGLSNNPRRRLRELNSEQAPCPIIGVRYIAVKDNATVEKALHQRFKKNRKHGEWFDFWIWELPIVEAAFDQAENPSRVFGKLAIAGIMITVLGIGGISFILASSLNSGGTLEQREQRN